MRVTVGDVPVHPVLVSMSAHGAPVGPEYWRHCNVMKCTEIFQWCGRASRMNKLQKLLCTFTRSKSSQLSSSLDSIISFRCAVLFCEFKCWCCVPRWKNRMSNSRIQFLCSGNEDDVARPYFVNWQCRSDEMCVSLVGSTQTASRFCRPHLCPVLGSRLSLAACNVVQRTLCRAHQ